MPSPGDVLFRLADVSTVWIVADVPEYELGAVKVGAVATIRVRSLPGRTFSGRVALIYPQVSNETRTTKVRIGSFRTVELRQKLIPRSRHAAFTQSLCGVPNSPWNLNCVPLHMRFGTFP